MNLQNSKKVAFVASVYSHLKGFHLPFMKLLQDKGCEVHAFGGGVQGKSGIEQAGVICHDISFHRNPFKVENVQALRGLIFGFKQYKFDVVHLHTPVASILGRVAAGVAGVPSVMYTAHGFHFYKKAPISYWMFYYPVERLMAHWTDFLITMNQEDYEKAMNFSVRKEVLYVPGVGLDLEKYSMPEDENVLVSKRNELGLAKDDFIILCVAELIPRKNHIQLIKAIEKLIDQGKDVQCLLVGNGDGSEVLTDYVSEHKLETNIHFLGFRRDIPQLLAAADVVALLSIHEGLPRVLMEAMAVGKPIVATNIRGNRDLVEDGQTGILVPPGDVGAVVSALMKLRECPELRIRMGQNSKERVKQYDLNNVIQYMEKIYDQALQI